MKHSQSQTWDALEYDAKTDAAEIDDFREGVIKKWKQWAVELEPERVKWLNKKVPRN